MSVTERIAQAVLDELLRRRDELEQDAGAGLAWVKVTIRLSRRAEPVGVKFEKEAHWHLTVST